MSRLVIRFVLRRMARNWPGALLSCFGVALGVAVFLAIRIANVSVLQAFTATVDAVAGNANLEVDGGPAGLDERFFPYVSALPGVNAAAPLILANVPIDRAPGAHLQRALPAGAPETFLIIGIDPLRQWHFDPEQRNLASPGLVGPFMLDPTAALVTRSLATECGLRPGDRLPSIAGSRAVSLHVLGCLAYDALEQAYGGDVAVMDIAGAQETFGQPGKISRILLIVNSAALPHVQGLLRRMLPPSVRVGPPAGRSLTVEKMLGAFDFNLEALSLIALFVGLFLIYNSLSSVVVRHRAELGTLRCVGVTGGGLFTLVVVEALILGIVGSSAGVAAGYVMARGLLGSVAATVTALYVQVQASQVHASIQVLGLAWAIGVLASLVGAILPACEAATIEPATVIRQGAQVRVSMMRWRAFVVGSTVLLSLSILLSALARNLLAPKLGMAAALGILAGFALLAAPLCRVIGMVGVRVAGHTHGISVRAGASFLLASLERVWVVVAALGASLAMFVALAVMIGSFRLTVTEWVSQTVVGDVYVAPGAGASISSTAVLPAELLRRIDSVPGIRLVDPYRRIEIAYRDSLVYLVARNWQAVALVKNYTLRSGSLAVALAGLAAGRSVLVSGPFADRYRVSTGQQIALDTPTGVRSFRVAGIFRDYTSEQGLVMMSLPMYRKLWRDDAVSSVALYAQTGVSAEDLARDVAAAFPRSRLLIRTNKTLKRVILGIFDQTFRVTYSLEAVSVVVALLGIASTLLTLVISRSRQIAILRAVGASGRQVVGVILTEAILIALSSWALGLACGGALSVELIDVVLPGFFHWTVQPYWQPWISGQALLLIVPASLVAAIIPAISAIQIPISQALRTE
jgi:putative ABC transport system permease protein